MVLRSFASFFPDFGFEGVPWFCGFCSFCLTERTSDSKKRPPPSLTPCPGAAAHRSARRWEPRSSARWARGHIGSEPNVEAESPAEWQVQEGVTGDWLGSY